MMFRTTLLSLITTLVIAGNANAQIISNPVVTTFRPYPGMSIRSAPVITYYPATPVVSYRVPTYSSFPLRGLPVLRNPIPAGTTVYSPVTVYSWPTAGPPPAITAAPPTVSYSVASPPTTVSPPMTMGSAPAPAARTGCGCSGN